MSFVRLEGELCSSTDGGGGGDAVGQESSVTCALVRHTWRGDFLRGSDEPMLCKYREIIEGPEMYIGAARLRHDVEAASASSDWIYGLDREERSSGI